MHALSLGLHTPCVHGCWASQGARLPAAGSRCPVKRYPRRGSCWCQQACLCQRAWSCRSAWRCRSVQRLAGRCRKAARRAARRPARCRNPCPWTGTHPHRLRSRSAAAPDRSSPRTPSRSRVAKPYPSLTSSCAGRAKAAGAEQKSTRIACAVVAASTADKRTFGAAGSRSG